MRKLDIRDALAVFYRRRWLGLTVIGAVLAATYVANYLTYPVYRSSVKILVERAPGLEIPFSREQIAFKKAEITQTQCELVRSLPVLEEVVRRLELDKRPLPAGTLRDRVHALARKVMARYRQARQEVKRFIIARVLGGTYRPPEPADAFREAVDRLAERVSVEPVPNSDLISATVRDHEAAMAARIVNAMAEIYLRRDVEAQKQRARLVYDLIDAEVRALLPAYEQAERELDAFEKAHHARVLSEQIRSKIQEISSLEVAYAELVETQSSKILALNLELARLRQVYDANHPKVLAAQSELEEARKRLGAHANGDAEAGTLPDSEAAGALLERISRAKRELDELSRLDGEYARLQRRKEQEEELYLSLKKKREEAQIAEATRAAGTRIVEMGVPAARPSSPRKLLNLLLGLAGGLFLAGGLCVTFEFFDRSVRFPEDASRTAGISTVWSIPERRSGRLRRPWFRARGTRLDEPIRDFGSPEPFVRGFAAMFEQLCVQTSTERPRVIVVAGVSRGQGASTVSMNLAASCARLGGARTLLVDGDLERPSLSTRLNLDRSPGLADLLGGSDGWRDMVRPVGEDPLLLLLPAGRARLASLIASGSARLGEMIGQWRAAFDWVIMDSPPVLASASASVIGRYATGVILIVRAMQTRDEVLRTATERLRETGLRPLGVVLNRRRYIIPDYAYRRL